MATNPPRGRLRFAVLGPLTVDADGPLELGPLKQRTTLAVLLAHPNVPVSTDRLTEAVWDDDPPRTARKNLQVYVCNLRKVLDERIGAGDRLVHGPGGYLIRVAPDEHDLLQFKESVRAGREAARAAAPAAAARLLGRALRLWRGTPFAGLQHSAALSAEADRLSGHYVHAYEDWAEAELELGNSAVVADSIGEQVERYPERERLRAAQLTALFRSGRRTEAFAVFEELRRHLASEYGLPPSPVLESLYRSMLTGPQIREVRSAPAAAPEPTGFVGRHQQVAEVTGLLGGGAGRLVVLTGPAGAGKTALAGRLAGCLRERFPDGLLSVRMRDAAGSARPLGDVVAELASGAGIAEKMSGHPDRDAQLWCAWLRHHRLLVVLDDAVDEAGIRPLAAGLVESTVLVTARSRLAGLAHAYRVDVGCLSPDEAYTLVQRIIGVDRAASDPAAVRDIVTATGRLALAVQVAALRLAAMRYVPLREYAERLGSSRTLLDELVAGDLAVRPGAARTFADLTPAHRADLVRLAGSAAPVLQLQDAAAALRCPPDEARRRLESLVDAGAVLSPQDEVTAHAACFELPAPLRLYALEQCRAGDAGAGEPGYRRAIRASTVNSGSGRGASS